MTRLTEALERANAVPDSTDPDVAPHDSGRDGRAFTHTWHFEDAERQATVAAAVTSVTRSIRAAADAAGAAVSTIDTYEFAPEACGKLVVGPDADAAVAEQFRRLGAVLHSAQLRSGARSVMVASAVSGEGKTLTATNLAITLSHSYRRCVLLIDADLRRPSIHALFQLPNQFGLSDHLRHPDGGRLPITQVSATLSVLTGGPADPDPTSGLVSEAMKELLADAVDQFDWVVVDTPPVAHMADANLLASMIDTALVVVAARTTPYPLVKRAVEAIGTPRILGTVLNRVEHSEVVQGYGDYQYYGRSPGDKRPSKGPATSVAL